MIGMMINNEFTLKLMNLKTFTEKVVDFFP